MTRSTKDPVLPGLNPDSFYWCQRGHVACGRHTPYPGSDTWVWDSWQEMTRADSESWQRELGKLAVCETCEAQRRAGK